MKKYLAHASDYYYDLIISSLNSEEDFPREYWSSLFDYTVQTRTLDLICPRRVGKSTLIRKLSCRLGQGGYRVLVVGKNVRMLQHAFSNKTPFFLSGGFLSYTTEEQLLRYSSKEPQEPLYDVALFDEAKLYINTDVAKVFFGVRSPI